MARQHMVALPPRVYEHLQKLRGELSQKTGREVGVGETVARALQCLEDAHGRGTWLSPAEMEPIMAQRVRHHLAAVLAQVIPQIAGVDLEKVGFPDGRIEGRTVLYLADGREVEFVPPAPVLEPIRLSMN